MKTYIPGNFSFGQKLKIFISSTNDIIYFSFNVTDFICVYIFLRKYISRDSQIWFAFLINFSSSFSFLQYLVLLLLWFVKCLGRAMILKSKYLLLGTAYL